MSRLRLALAGSALLAAGPALAVPPIPLQAGTYCGIGDARIVVDVAHDVVQIDGYVCSFPVIAADLMQSQSCSKQGTTPGKQTFDLRVVGRDFIHQRNWYSLCGPVPANVTDPNTVAPPAKGGLVQTTQ